MLERLLLLLQYILAYVYIGLRERMRDTSESVFSDDEKWDEQTPSLIQNAFRIISGKKCNCILQMQQNERENGNERKRKEKTINLPEPQNTLAIDAWALKALPILFATGTLNRIVL